MERRQYVLDLKRQVVLKYRKGIFGYKRLAHEFGLTRDLVRSWCLNPRLNMSTIMGNKKKKKKSEISKKEYEDARAAAAFWETYAKMLEEEIAKQSKKK